MESWTEIGGGVLLGVAAQPIHEGGHAVATRLMTGWWAIIFLLVRQRPRYKWALIGPSFVLAIVLVNWPASATLSPFGYHNVGASDAAKFLLISGINPVAIVAMLIAVAAAVALIAARLFRMAAPSRERVARNFGK